MSKLAIYYDTWQKKNLSNIYNKGVHFKSNPRSLEYMEDLATKKFEDIEIKNILNEDELNNIDLDKYSEIVLLYPDAIGLGWSKIDNYISKNFNQMKKITILNGRRRVIVFNSNNLFGLRFKRFLEKALIVETIFTIYFVVSTPFLIIKDLLHGKK